jgi:hypothetical protein
MIQIRSGANGGRHRICTCTAACNCIPGYSFFKLNAWHDHIAKLHVVCKSHHNARIDTIEMARAVPANAGSRARTKDRIVDPRANGAEQCAKSDVPVKHSLASLGLPV